MSSPYPQSHLHSSSPHSKVERTNVSTSMTSSSDPQPIPPYFANSTPMPTFIAQQPSPSRSPLPPPPSSTSLAQSRLPLRKRPAKDQKPTQLQWQPIETANTTPTCSNTEPYPQRHEIMAPSFGLNSTSGRSLFTGFLEHHNTPFSYHQDQHSQASLPPPPQQQSNDKYRTNFLLNSPSHLDPPPPLPAAGLTQPLLPTSIPTKSNIHQQLQPQLAKKKHTSATDENDRPIKKTKRGRPPLSSSASSSSTSSTTKLLSSSSTSSTTKPLSSHATTNNKANLGSSNINSLGTSNINNNKTSLSKSAASSSNSKHTSMLYCLCRKPYDEPQFMIACDRCEEWFHGECIGIDEKQGEFVDSYYCTDCVKASGKKTSWKPTCSNTLCPKAARTGKNQGGQSSKYCSAACGMQVARERLKCSDQQQQQSSNNDDDTDLTNFRTRMEQLSNSRLSLFADRDDRLRLTRIKNEKQRAINTINGMNFKQQFLQQLIKTVEQEQQTNDTCGFDSRLLWDDEHWDGVTHVEIEPTLQLIKSEMSIDQNDWDVCQKPKRCQRHNGWIKLKTSELEQERDEQFVVLSILARERKLIKTRMNNRLDDMNIARSLVNGTLLHFE